MTWTAWSLGAREFDFSGPLSASSPLPVGAPVLLSTGTDRFLGQVVEKRTVEAGAPSASGRAVVGRGILIARLREDSVEGVGADDVFDDATVEPAPAAAVRAWLAGALGSEATLDLGALRHPAGETSHLMAAGFNRHTFLCGQSGSGKTYALGVILEQLLLRTSLRLVVLDPNSDYVGLDRLPEAAALAGQDGALVADQICVFRSRAGAHRLRVRYGRLPFRQQAMVLALDPLRDADEYDLLNRLAEQIATTEYSISDLRALLRPDADAAQQRLARRIDNLGVARWSIWAERDQPPIVDQLPEDWRAAVLDLGDIAEPEERSVVAASILTGLWARRQERQPVLIVMDEAHNVCPQEPADTHQALAIEHTVRIAAEGRKYGLYLLLATQSPRKLHASVLAQCENLLLMKTNSVADVEHLADVFSHVHRGLVMQATGFRLGEGLAAGRIVPAPQFFTAGRRLSPEGGADIPTTWARPPSPK